MDPHDNKLFEKKEPTVPEIAAKSFLTIITTLGIIFVVGVFFVIITFALYGWGQEQQAEKRATSEASQSSAAAKALIGNPYVVTDSSRDAYSDTDISGALDPSAYAQQDDFARQMVNTFASDSVSTMALEYATDKSLIVHKAEGKDAQQLSEQGWRDLLTMTQQSEIYHLEVSEKGALVISLSPYESDYPSTDQLTQDNYAQALKAVASLQVPDSLNGMSFEAGFTVTQDDGSHLAVEASGSLETLKATDILTTAALHESWPYPIHTLKVKEQSDYLAARFFTQRVTNGTSHYQLDQKIQQAQEKTQPVAQKVLDQVSTPAQLTFISDNLSTADSPGPDFLVLKNY